MSDVQESMNGVTFSELLLVLGEKDIEIYRLRRNERVLIEQLNKLTETKEDKDD